MSWVAVDADDLREQLERAEREIRLKEDARASAFKSWRSAEARIREAADTLDDALYRKNHSQGEAWAQVERVHDLLTAPEQTASSTQPNNETETDSPDLPTGKGAE